MDDLALHVLTVVIFVLTVVTLQAVVGWFGVDLTLWQALVTTVLISVLNAGGEA